MSLLSLYKLEQVYFWCRNLELGVILLAFYRIYYSFELTLSDANWYSRLRGMGHP